MKKTIFMLTLIVAVITLVVISSKFANAGIACPDSVTVYLSGIPVVGAHVTIHDATCGCNACSGNTGADGSFPTGPGNGTYCVDATYSTGGQSYSGAISATFTSGLDGFAINLQSGSNHICLPD